MTRRVLWALSLVASVAAAGFFFVLPGYLKRRAIEEASRSGIELTIEQAAVTLSGVRFDKLAARMSEASVTVEQATAGWRTLRRVHLRGVVANVPDFALLRIDELHAPSGVENAEIEDGRVVMTGNGATVEMTGCTGEIGEGTYHLRASAVKGLFSQSPFGPWKLAADRAEGNAITQLSLNEKSSITATSRADSLLLAAKIPRARVRSLALPAAAFGLSDDAEIELTGSVGYLSKADAGDGNFDFHLFGYSLGFMPLPVDVALGAAWRGSGQSARVEHATFSVGPFGGTAQGTVRGRYPEFRLDLTFESSPVPCDRFGRQAAGGLLDLLGSAGGKTVTGEVKLAGSLVFDLAHPEQDRLNLKPSADCSFTL